MNKEKFLNSGLLEQYILGLTTAEENKIVRRYVDTFPEVRAELSTLKQAMDAYVAEHVAPSRPQVGDKPLVENGWSAPLATRRSAKAGLPWFIAVVLGCIVMYLLQVKTTDRRQITQLEAEHAALQQYYDRDHQLEERERTMTGAVRDTRTVSTVLRPTSDNELTIFAVYHHNPATEKSWLDVTQLPFLEPARVYHVWNVGPDGHRLVATLQDNRRRLLELPYQSEIKALEITVGADDIAANRHDEELLLRGEPR